MIISVVLFFFMFYFVLHKHRDEKVLFINRNYRFKKIGIYLERSDTPMMNNINLNIIQKISPFVIYQSADGVILCNEDIECFAHTHLHNLNTAKWLVDLSIKKKLPRDIPRYLLISLIRVNSDERYVTKANELLSNKRKSDKYINRSNYR